MSRRRVLRLASPVATTVTWLAAAITTLAASPSPGADVGDPRSGGQGPGLVGDPASALVAVIVIGLISVVATLVYVRLTAGRNT